MIKRQLFSVLFLSLFCVSTFMQMETMTDDPIVFTPSLHATYELYLSIDSEYYHLDNILTKVYDSTTTDWNWCNPEKIILQSTTYRLRIFDKETRQLLFFDRRDQTRSDNYRIIKLNATKVINNHYYPISYHIYNDSFYTPSDPSPYISWTELDGDVSNTTTDEFPAIHYDNTEESYYALSSLSDQYYSFYIKYTGTLDSGDTAQFRFTRWNNDINWDYRQLELFFRYNGSQKEIGYIDNDGEQIVYSGSDVVPGDWYYFQIALHGSTYSLWCNDYPIENYAPLADDSISRVYRTNTAYPYYFDVENTLDAGDDLYLMTSPFRNISLTVDPGHSALFGYDYITENYTSEFFINSVLQSTGIFTEEKTLRYDTPTRSECYLQFTDNSTIAKFLEFDTFRTYLDGVLLTTPTFYKNLGNTISIRVCDLSNSTLQTFTYTITEDRVNYITIPVSVLYLVNNADEPIDINLLEQTGHYQSTSGLSWDLNEVHTRPNDLEYSNEGLSYLQNEYQDHNKVMYSNASHSTQYGDDGIQFDNDMIGWEITEASGTNLYYNNSITLDRTISNSFHYYNSPSATGTVYSETQQTGTVISGWFGANYEFGLYLFEDSETIGVLRFDNPNHYEWYDGSYNTIDNAAPDTWHHFCLDFSASNDEVDIYLNGSLVSSQSLNNPLEYEIDRIRVTTLSATDYDGYLASLYVGDSFDEAMQSLYPSSSFMIDNRTIDYKTEGCLDWGDDSEPDLSSIGEYLQGSEATLEVADSYSNHLHPLKLSRTATGGSGRIYYEFNSVGESTIYMDFYLATDDISSTSTLYILESGASLPSSNIACALSLGPSRLRITYGYGTGTTYRDLNEFPCSDTWYHFGFEIDCKNDEFNLFYNGELIYEDRPFYMGNDFSSIQSFTLTATSSADYSTYLNAFGVSTANYEPFSNQIHKYYKTNTLQWGYTDSYDYKRYNSSGDVIDGIVDWGSANNPDLNVIDNISTELGCTYSVISEFNKHENVLELDDQNSTGNVDIKKDWGVATADSIIECYIAKDSVVASTSLLLVLNEGGSIRIQLKFDVDDLEAYYSSTYNPVYSNWMKAENWYHLKIVCDDSANTFDIYIDGTLQGDDIAYRSASSVGIDTFRILTDTSDSGYTCYVDSLGQSSDYSSGDNQQWYDFTNECTGDTSCTIAEYVDGHQYVLNLTDNDNSERVFLHYYIEGQYSVNTIEMWIYSTDTTEEFRFCTLYEDDFISGDDFMMFYIENNNLYYDNGLISPVIGKTGILDNTWYHFKIEYDSVSNYFDAWLNGIQFADDVSAKQQDYIKSISIITDTSNNNFNAYIDGIGIKSERNYQHNQNIPIPFITEGSFEWWQAFQGNVSFQSTNFNLQYNHTVPDDLKDIASIHDWGQSGDPVGWDIDETYAGVDITVDDVGKRQDSLTLSDAENAGSGTKATAGLEFRTDAFMNYSFSDLKAGYISFDLYYDLENSNGDLFRVDFQSAGISALSLYFYLGSDNPMFPIADEILVFSGTDDPELGQGGGGTSTTENVILTDVDSQWMHFLIEYDCDADEIFVWVDGIAVLSLKHSFMTTIDYLDSVNITSEYATESGSEFDSTSKNLYLNNLYHGLYLSTAMLSYFNQTDLFEANLGIPLDLNWTLTYEFEDRISMQDLYNCSIFWDHFSLRWTISSWALYSTETLIYEHTSFPQNFEYFRFQAWQNTSLWIDAIDYTLEMSNLAFSHGANLRLNQSNDLWCWEAFPQWESGFYQQSANWNDVVYSSQTYEIVEYSGKKNVLHLENEYLEGSYDELSFTSQTKNSIEIFVNEVEERGLFGISADDIIGWACLIRFYTSSFRIYHGESWGSSLFNYEGFAHIRIELDCSTDTFSMWLNNELKLSKVVFSNGMDFNYFNKIRMGAYDASHPSSIYYYGLKYSWDEDYFPYCSTLENTTTSKLPMNFSFSERIYPYSEKIVPYNQSVHQVRIDDSLGNILEYQFLNDTQNDNEIIYTPANTRECFLSIADQAGNYLAWENYRLFLNDTQIYSNQFFGPVGSIYTVSIYDRFNSYITGENITVSRSTNYIPITITLHNLKIYNQQEKFIFANLSRNNFYWSEWISPGEFVEYHLVPGTYDLNITEWETATSTMYEYSLSGDDYLLVQSQNTFFNVLNNIENVNSTIGNQITNVNISISNEMSDIQSQQVNIEILLNNTNSTLTNILIEQNVLLEAIQSDIVQLEINQSTLINSINETISNLILSQNTFLNLMNSTIVDMLVQQNVDLDTMASDIYNYYVEQIAEIDAINSTISELIIDQAITLGLLNASLYSLHAQQILEIEGINSTIMDAIVDQDAFLSLMNSTMVNFSVEQLASIEGINATIMNALISQEAFLHLIDVNITDMMLTQSVIQEMTGDIEDLLVEQGIYLQQFNSNITNLLLLQQNSLNFINNTIQYSFISMNSSLAIVSSKLTTVENQIGNNLHILNSSIYYMQNNLSQEISVVHSNITSQFNELSQDIFLINDSIYTVVAQLSQNISIDNSIIKGNLELLLSYDAFLDEIKHQCLFSEDLNWSDTAHNYTLIQDRVRLVEFYNNDTQYETILKIRYNNSIETFVVGADENIQKMIPADATEYKVEYSNGTVIQDWTSIDDSTIVWGIRTDTYAQADVVVQKGITSADFISASLLIGLSVFLYTYSIKRMKPYQLTKYSKSQKNLTRKDMDRTGILDAFGDE